KNDFILALTIDVHWRASEARGVSSALWETESTTRCANGSSNPSQPLTRCRQCSTLSAPTKTESGTERSAANSEHSTPLSTLCGHAGFPKADLYLGELERCSSAARIYANEQLKNPWRTISATARPQRGPQCDQLTPQSLRHFSCCLARHCMRMKPSTSRGSYGS